MTPDQFNAALTRCIEAEARRDNAGFPCYPIIGIGIRSTADNFSAYDNERCVLLCGVFSEAINQDAIDRAVALAAGSSLNDSEDGITVIPCVIAPYDAPLSASSEDVLVYYVAMHNDGMLTGMLEFTDFDEVYWDDEDDEDFIDFDEE